MQSLTNFSGSSSLLHKNWSPARHGMNQSRSHGYGIFQRLLIRLRWFIVDKRPSRRWASVAESTIAVFFTFSTISATVTTKSVVFSDDSFTRLWSTSARDVFRRLLAQTQSLDVITRPCEEHTSAHAHPNPTYLSARQTVLRLNQAGR